MTIATLLLAIAFSSAFIWARVLAVVRADKTAAKLLSILLFGCAVSSRAWTNPSRAWFACASDFDFSLSTSLLAAASNDDKQGMAASVERGTAPKLVQVKAGKPFPLASNNRDSRKDGNYFSACGDVAGMAPGMYHIHRTSNRLYADARGQTFPKASRTAQRDLISEISWLESRNNDAAIGFKKTLEKDTPKGI